MLYIDGDYAFTQPVKHLTALKIDSPGHSFDFVWLCNMRNEGCHWYKSTFFWAGSTFVNKLCISEQLEPMDWIVIDPC